MFRPPPPPPAAPSAPAPPRPPPPTHPPPPPPPPPPPAPPPRPPAAPPPARRHQQPRPPQFLLARHLPAIPRRLCHLRLQPHLHPVLAQPPRQPGSALDRRPPRRIRHNPYGLWHGRYSTASLTPELQVQRPF